jgi:aromatic ring-opening dioxygenase catalytic subunit (LigB family)
MHSMGNVVAAMVSVHAPQLINPPPTEDPEQVRLTIEAMHRLGQRLDESNPDALLLIAGDHLEGFFLNCIAPFTVYVAEQAAGSFAGQHWTYPVATDLALALLERGQEAGFDLAFSQDAELDHASLVPLHHILGQRPIPIVPLFVNVYVPPQPAPRRCFELGQALAGVLRDRPERVAVLASGGMSHYPGTDRYGSPDYDFDYALLDALKAGRGEALLRCTPAQLDESGNIELRTWMVAMGMVGAERPLDVITYQPSWHHGYAVGDWKLQPKPERAA